MEAMKVSALQLDAPALLGSLERNRL